MIDREYWLGLTPDKVTAMPIGKLVIASWGPGISHRNHQCPDGCKVVVLLGTGTKVKRGSWYNFKLWGETYHNSLDEAFNAVDIPNMFWGGPSRIEIRDTTGVDPLGNEPDDTEVATYIVVDKDKNHLEAIVRVVAINADRAKLTEFINHMHTLAVEDFGDDE